MRNKDPKLSLQTRDDSYTAFAAYNGIYCLAKGQTTLGSAQVNGCTTPNVDNFIRSVTIKPQGVQQMFLQLLFRFRFTDAKCQTGKYCHSSVDTTCLSTVNPIQSP